MKIANITFLSKFKQVFLNVREYCPYAISSCVVGKEAKTLCTKKREDLYKDKL